MQQRDKLENHDTKTILDKLVRIERCQALAQMK